MPYWDEGQKNNYKWFKKGWWKRHLRKKHLKKEYKTIYKSQ